MVNSFTWKDCFEFSDLVIVEMYLVLMLNIHIYFLFFFLKVVCLVFCRIWPWHLFLHDCQWNLCLMHWLSLLGWPKKASIFSRMIRQQLNKQIPGCLLSHLILSNIFHGVGVGEWIWLPQKIWSLNYRAETQAYITSGPMSLFREHFLQKPKCF